MADDLIFSPLQGTEELDYLNHKYAYLEADNPFDKDGGGCNSNLRKFECDGKKSFTKLRKKPIVTGGDEVDRKVNRSSSFSRCQGSAKVVNDEAIPHFDSFKDLSEFCGNKPAFNHEPHCRNEPFVLSKSDNHQISGAINQYLRDYQRDGVEFMYGCYKDGRGCLLCDDMGLGKTVQVIAFMSALLFKTGTEKDIVKFKPDVVRKFVDPSYGSDSKHICFLIVSPASVLYNWLDELETWGYFSVGKFHGIDKIDALERVKRGKAEVLLTTFETFRSHVDILNEITWNAIIVDEVHKIKESKSRVTVALKKLNVKCRCGLTGTALQNSMKELWCLLDWANPSCLGSEKDFEANYVKPIQQGQKYDASKRELAEARIKQKMFSQKMSIWMIRRTKALIRDQLPSKSDQVVFCRPAKYQRSVYKAILQCADVRLILDQSNPCECGSGKKRGKCCVKANSKGHSIKSLMFAYMHLLTKTSNHLGLILPSSAKSKTALITRNEILEIVDDPAIKNGLVDLPTMTNFDSNYCGKIRVLTDLLNIFESEQDKVLIFSYTTKLLDILENYTLIKGYEYRRIDGKTKSESRLRFVKEFNCDRHIFACLVSTRAGGVGLNITGANKVVIFDPNWNPSHDLQAQDRAYRIGQRQDVEVYRLVTAGTIEENMYLRQIYKQQLEKAVVSSENSKRYFNGGIGDRCRGEIFGIENMFRFRDGSSCLTDEILKRHANVEKGLAGHPMSSFEVSSAPGRSKNFIDLDVSSTAEISVSDTDGISSSAEADGSLRCPVKRRSKIKISKRNGVPSSDSSDRDSYDGSVGPSARDGLAGRRSSVSKVLRSKGVVHTHANEDIVGASKGEDHMTECALNAVFVDNVHSQELAIRCNPYRKQRRKSKKFAPSDKRNKLVISGCSVIVGKTPPSVQKHHFETMAAEANLSVSEFARTVSETSKSESAKLLKSFYSKLHRDLNLEKHGVDKMIGEWKSDDDGDAITANRPKCERKSIRRGLRLDDKTIEWKSGRNTIRPDSKSSPKRETDEILRTDEKEIGRENLVAPESRKVCRDDSHSIDKDLSQLDELLNFDDEKRKPAPRKKPDSIEFNDNDRTVDKTGESSVILDAVDDVLESLIGGGSGKTPDAKYSRHSANISNCVDKHTYELLSDVFDI